VKASIGTMTMFALGALCLFGPISTLEAAEPSSPTYNLDIPAQNLNDALQTFALASQHKLIYSSDLVDGKKSPALKGNYTTEQALKRLLAGTNLQYEVTSSGLVMIRAPDASIAHDAKESNPPPDKEGKKSSSAGFRVAQVDQGQTSGPATVEKQEKTTAKKKPIQLEEVVVTGSRIPTVAGQQTLPVQIYTGADIATSGQTTLGEYLNTLPEASTSTNGIIAEGFAGVQTVQLHGLPIGTTLTLIDGRRTQDNILGFFDLGSIPVSAIDRIEILPVGASAVYGADALGGAVNIVLRKNFTGFEINATLDHAPGVDNPGVNMAWGRAGERGSVSLVLSYQYYGELLGIQREPTNSTTLPPDFQPIATSFDSCAPGNVFSVDGSDLPALSSPQAAIPAGITGKPTIAQFIPTAGKLNLCNPDQYVSITPRSQRGGALLSGHYELSESTDLFTEVLFSHRHLQEQIGPLISVSQFFGGTVPADNPYNPFGEAVNVGFEYPGTGTIATQSSSLIQPTVGLRGTLFSDWHYELTARWSWDRLNNVGLYANSQSIANALASSDPATSLNPFASGAPGTSQLLASFTNPGIIQAALLDDRMLGGQGIVRGPLAHLPSGDLQGVFGAEYNKETQDSTYTGTSPYLLGRKTYAAFTEARVPLLAVDKLTPARERLTLTVAGRYDHSNDYGGKATWQGGLLWRPVDALTLSGSYGQSYKAPQLLQISGPQFVNFAPVGYLDPFRGDQPITYSVNQVSGPNFNLKPETGNSSTLTLAYGENALPGLRASLTWYDLKITNYIGTQGIQTLLDNPNLFPGAVIRAPPTPQDIQNGYLGVITQINETYYNFGELRVDGFDANVSYAIDSPIGRFTPSVAIANIYKWQSAILPGLPPTENVSQATLVGVGWAPRWKGTAALTWQRGSLSMNIAGRYTGRYLDYQDLVANNHETGNTWIIDAGARVEVGQAFLSTTPLLAHAYVALAAVNLFNRVPPLSYTGSWYDFSEYDARGRYIQLSVGARY
jgi:iron complex outermembrane recepter protein